VDTLSGSVERITYYNQENGYTVLRMRPDRTPGKTTRAIPGLNQIGLVTIVGNLPELTPGEFIEVQGRWVNHPKHGYQLDAMVCKQALPATLTGIRRYLGSGLVKGIGPGLAKRIVAHFGTETLEIIEKRPQRLREVADIGPKRTQIIIQAWEEQRHVKEIMLFLHAHGVSTNLAVKIYKTYGDNALETVQGNPYQLSRDIYGVGFKTADKIAQDMGLTTDHPSRIEAGLVYALNEMSNDGHVFASQDGLVHNTAGLLEIDPQLIPLALERLSQDGRIRSDVIPLSHLQNGTRKTHLEGGKGQSAIEIQDLIRSETFEAIQPKGKPVIYLTPLYYAEKGIAERLGKLTSTIPSNLSDIPPAFVSIDSQLNTEQREAIRTALTHPVSVLTGGPGTGKTTCLKALIKILDSSSKRYALASPTGRAAKRLTEATGRPASTIHRLLGFSPVEGFKHNVENPLLIDILVVDEASMLDLILMNTLLKALRPGTHLLLVGDVDQLPSVGAGDVLRDVIASDIAPVTRLSTIFRQEEGSQIITNAHNINLGKMPVFSKENNGDFFLFPAEDALTTADWIIEVATERIPQKFGYNPVRDIQVLAPMYRGDSGVQTLNERLQEVLNPASPQKPEAQLFGTTFRPGDKVMQTQNNYDKEVFNGDIGFVLGINLIEHVMTIEIDGRPVEYETTEADELVLAYAVTVHKAQGSEFPVVVLPIISAHYLMLQRNLLYTAITRAENLCVLVGNRRSIGIAVRNNKVAKRNSALDWRLREFGS
jgi:exodeoxyribonuclease V alpha subunit